MRYTIKNMREQFPSDDKCLEYIFQSRYNQFKTCPSCGVVEAKYYKVKSRKSYECKECRHQIFPLAGTIFEKSSTPLTDWFHALYLFSVSKNGVSAKEIERHVGVSYKTAHRMAKMIRLLMAENGQLGSLGTPIEADEAYIGGRRKQDEVKDNKTPIIALLEVGGHVRTTVVERATSENVLPFLYENIKDGSTLHTDESKIYRRLDVPKHYEHRTVRHIGKEFVTKDGVTTNHVEGFFGNTKRALDGTYHCVSPKYLGSYISEFAFRYNHRDELIFPLLISKAVKPAL